MATLMRWLWWRKPKSPEIPPYRAPPVKVDERPKAKEEPSIVVEEMDTSAMTRTGVHRAWRRLTGRDDTN